MPTASGSFDVTVTPHETPSDSPVGRMRLHKQFHGDLDAIATGEMIATSEPLTSAAVYVAIDRVSGTLHGRSGSFLLAHRGTMTPDQQQLSVIVVPGSGTGQLTGLSGSLAIHIAGKQHSYVLEYRLDDES